MKSSFKSNVAVVILALCTTTTAGLAADGTPPGVKDAVDTAILPLMAKDRIPGMAVGITIAGKTYVLTYGVASRDTRQPVTGETLFEIGSITKTFTATLACYAQVGGYLSLSDKTSQYFPLLKGSEFGEVSLLNLGTHTPGGLPLQVPDNIANNDQLLQYFKNWRSTYPPGTYRTYANPGIGTLGWITAKSMGQDFAGLIEQRLFAGLGMKNSYINIPEAKVAQYAQGYTKEDVPIRMATGVLSSEAYGVRTTAGDLVRFVDANMNPARLDAKIRRAITETHRGYFKAGPMTQDLIWEQYPYPVGLKTLLEGNSPEMIYNATPVSKIDPPEAPQENVWINKTGSTNGFGAYVAFVPGKRLGIVVLANKSYPIEERVSAAFQILTALGEGMGGNRK